MSVTINSGDRTYHISSNAGIRKVSIVSEEDSLTFDVARITTFPTAATTAETEMEQSVYDPLAQQSRADTLEPSPFSAEQIRWVSGCADPDCSCALEAAARQPAAGDPNAGWKDPNSGWKGLKGKQNSLYFTRSALYSTLAPGRATGKGHPEQSADCSGALVHDPHLHGPPFQCAPLYHGVPAYHAACHGGPTYHGAPPFPGAVLVDGAPAVNGSNLNWFGPVRLSLEGAEGPSKESVRGTARRLARLIGERAGSAGKNVCTRVRRGGDAVLTGAARFLRRRAAAAQQTASRSVTKTSAKLPAFRKRREAGQHSTPEAEFAESA
ncbi:hypothetical protein GNI_108060 [Gregarina niphandrodes]|uniref:Uncharacterized protein n=1 Tax=Gregarina niphandrodes TaxID=110365 RepID=A0A023B417_GRENI|nr:hypothetical protein GNI_108060 [Gregarina niphandrodes]EZG55864.1 hypothetical protein GNI_108060 [Gregarina niphandrodes]|eukprot:XP_011131435.1 hypothetical protein GNI_108060 [Gregarina niphandrodes]